MKRQNRGKIISVFLLAFSVSLLKINFNFFKGIGGMLGSFSSAAIKFLVKLLGTKLF